MDFFILGLFALGLAVAVRILYRLENKLLKNKMLTTIRRYEAQKRALNAKARELEIKKALA